MLGLKSYSNQWFHDWKALYGITAGMTTRCGGISKPPFSSLNVGFHVGDDSLNVLENRKRIARKLSIPLDRWVVAEQPHGTSVCKVNGEDAGKGADSIETVVRGVDGLYTDVAGLLLVSLFADCVPIFFHSQHHRYVGIAHAGWKGTVGNIAGNMIKCMEREGVKASEIDVVIGPAIGSCCYEVNEDVIEKVRKWQFSEPVFYRKDKGKFMLDLKSLNRQLLEQSGVSKERIYVSTECTSCSNHHFYSHRKESGKTGRMMAYIGLDKVE